MADNTLIKFVSTTDSVYDALATKDEDTIYFLSDTGKIAKGSHIYTDYIVMVNSNTLPLTGLENHIYLLSNLEGYIYDVVNSEWKQVITPVSNIAKSYTIMFNITSTLELGVLPIPQIAEETGTISNISVIATTAGTTDAEIDIEKISEDDLESESGSYISIFNTGYDIKIPTGKYTNKSATQYQLSDNNINKNDILRLNVKNTGSGLQGISLAITINI